MSKCDTCATNKPDYKLNFWEKWICPKLCSKLFYFFYKDYVNPNTPVDEVEFTNVDWCGPNGTNAALDKRLLTVSLNGRLINYTYDKLEGWTLSADKKCDSYVCAFFMRNGKWTGGKFDWSGIGYTSQNTKSLRDGYIKKLLPLIDGEEFLFCLLDIDADKRTNVKKLIWKN